MAAPPIFLPGAVGYSVIKRAKAGKTLVAVAGSGRQVRAQLWAYPMWEWDLTWEWLPDNASGSTASDFKTLMGQFLAEAGAYGGFLYYDTDENRVLSQPIGTGDGTTTEFLLVKSFGLGSYIGTEPIGYLTYSESLPFNVYVGGVLKTEGTDYTFDVSTPYAQTLTFTSAPGSGVGVTVDMSFFYYVHFQDDTYDFENFMYQLWSQKKITVESLRG